MNNKAKMFFDPDRIGAGWSEVTSGARNEIVFERLNRSYGAFQIRTNYDNTLLKAFSATVLLAMLLTALYFLSPKAEPPVLIPETPAIQIDPTIVDPIVVPPVEPLTHPANKPNNPDEFSQPVVIDSFMQKDSVISSPILANNSPGNSNDTSGTHIENTIGTKGTGTAAAIPSDTALTFADIMPQFPGGDPELFHYLTTNARIPEIITEIGRVSEKVCISFIVEKDGRVTTASVIHGGSRYAELNKEALRVINKMPKWEPGQQNGNPVKVRLNLPIRFEVK